MLKVGPLPEAVLFAVQWGSEYFSHEEWLNWMQEYRLGYGRVYPESGHPWVPYDADKRVFPFAVVRWERGRPVVDLERFSERYWDNFARVVRECAKRDIVLQIQLYQRVFFAARDDVAAWETNYFHPRNNVNGYAAPAGGNGYGLWKAMVEDANWRRVHRRWVEHVLDAVGNNGNVIIDLMNEGAFRNRVGADWIKYTLDIIETWEKRTGNDLPVGMDFDHFYKKNDPGLEYVLGHKRMEVLICEGSEGHVVGELTAGDRKPLASEPSLIYRSRYRKPVVSTNSPGYSVDENPAVMRLYQWASMMGKVQGVGVYAKKVDLDFDDEDVRTYARQSRYLMEFFESLADYVKLKPGPAKITRSPGEHHLNMASNEEVVVYLHTGEFGTKVEAGGELELTALPLPNGGVEVVYFHPDTGKHVENRATIADGRLRLILPEFYEDIAVHIVFE